MRDEERDTAPMDLGDGAGRSRQGEWWWKAAVGLLLSTALIVLAAWVRLESRPLERPAHPRAAATASDDGAPRAPATRGSVWLRLPDDR